MIPLCASTGPRKRQPIPGPIELFQHGILRCAAWPIQTVEPFASPVLAALAGRLDELAESVQSRQATLCARLYVEIPKNESVGIRRTLLVRRRLIRSGTDEHPGAPISAEQLRRLTPETAAIIQRDERERCELAALHREFANLYAAEIERERAALRAATTSAEFQRALVLANPELAKRWRPMASGAAPVWKKSRAVQTEAAILFYLFRAATRPTPGGLWAGVAPVYLRRVPGEDRSGPGVQFIPAKRVIAASVNLAAFQRIVERLRSKPRYRTHPQVCMASSAHRHGSAWRYQTAGGAKHEWRTLAEDPTRDAVLELLADGKARDLEMLLDALALTGCATRELLQHAAEQLLDCGVLVSTLALPPAPGDCWEALDCVTRSLLDGDREFWAEVVQRIRVLCDALSQRLDDMAPKEVHETVAAVEREIGELCRWAGIDEPLRRPIVLIDLRVSFEAACSSSFWESMRDSAREVLGFYESHGAAEQLRRATLEALVGNPGAGQIARPFLEMVRLHGSTVELAGGSASNFGPPELFRRLQRDVLGRQWHWYERLAARGDRPVPASRPRAGFDGTIVFTVLTGQRIRAEWGRPHALCLTSRFVRLLDSGEGEYALASAVRAWYETWSSKGLEAAEVAGADVLNPNAAVRPRVTAERALGGGGEIPMADLIVESGPGILRPWLRRKNSPKAMIPVYNCTAAIGIDDACGQALYRMALGHGWEFVCRRLFPGFAALHIPQCSLPGGTVISPGRWFLDQSAVEALLAVDGPDRYLAWMRQARRLGLPERVWVATEQAPDEPLIYLPVSSPLAVRSLFARIASRPRPLEFAEMYGDSQDLLVTDESGKRYASEVALCWRDPSYVEFVFS